MKTFFAITHPTQNWIKIIVDKDSGDVFTIKEDNMDGVFFEKYGENFQIIFFDIKKEMD